MKTTLTLILMAIVTAALSFLCGCSRVPSPESQRLSVASSCECAPRHDAELSRRQDEVFSRWQSATNRTDKDRLADEFFGITNERAKLRSSK